MGPSFYSPAEAYGPKHCWCNSWAARKIPHTWDLYDQTISSYWKEHTSTKVSTYISLYLQYNYNIMNSCRRIIRAFLAESEPDALKARRRRHFNRRLYYAAGVNDVWAMDQHDKWGHCFGLWLHNGIDPFIGCNLWLKVWWTNRNPVLVGSYYIETVRRMRRKSNI